MKSLFTPFKKSALPEGIAETSWLHVIIRYCLFTIAFLIPVFPRYTGPFIFLMLLIWFIDRRFHISFPTRKIRNIYICVTAIYASYLIGLFYSDDLEKGFSEMLLRISLVLFPLIFLSASEILPSIISTLKAFIAGCLLISTILLIHALAVLIRSSENIFSYTDFTEFMNLNPIYFSLHLSFSIISLVWMILFRKSSENKILLIAAAIFFTLMIIIAASRQEIIALSVAIIILVLSFYRCAAKTRLGMLASLFFLLAYTGLITVFSKTRERFAEIATEMINATPSEFPTSISTRIQAWKASLELFSQNPLIGVGTGDTDDSLLKLYRMKNLSMCLRDRMNAHNQFLQTSIETGMHGLLTLLLLLVTGFYIAISTRDPLYFTFLTFFCLSIITESMLEQEKGVLFFSLFNSLFIANHVIKANSEKADEQFESS